MLLKLIYIYTTHTTTLQFIHLGKKHKLLRKVLKFQIISFYLFFEI